MAIDVEAGNVSVVTVATVDVGYEDKPSAGVDGQTGGKITRGEWGTRDRRKCSGRWIDCVSRHNPCITVIRQYIEKLWPLLAKGEPGMEVSSPVASSMSKPKTLDCPPTA